MNTRSLAIAIVLSVVALYAPAADFWVFTFYADDPATLVSDGVITNASTVATNVPVFRNGAWRNHITITVTPEAFSNGFGAVSAAVKNAAIAATPEPVYMQQDMVFMPFRGIVLGATNGTAYQPVPTPDGSDIMLIPRIASPYHSDAQFSNDLKAATADRVARRARIQSLKSDPDWISLTNQDAQYTAHFITLTNAIDQTTGTTKAALNALKLCVDDCDARDRRLRRLMKDIVADQK